MPLPTSDYSKTIARTAEHQMRQWAMGLEIQQRTEQQRALAELPERFHPYVAISRQVGAGGGEIARRVGQRLGWQVLDRELLHYIAEQHHLPRDMLEFVDETQTSWLFEALGKWLNQKLVTQSQYVTHLGHAVLLAAHHGSVVFVGRGAQFFLPRHRGLAVQIIAPREQRIAQVMQRNGLDRDRAEEYVDRTDQARRDFIQRYFHQDIRNAQLFDLVINRQQLTVDDAVEIITGQVQRRLAPPAAASKAET